MKWTLNKPTKPGWYWYKEYKGWPVKVVEVFEKGDKLHFGGWPVDMWCGFWAGPLEYPED